jgi:hypothetical protein
VGIRRSVRRSRAGLAVRITVDLLAQMMLSKSDLMSVDV